MAMKYAFDAYLDTVLQAASNADLDPLVEFITHAQISEDLSSSKEYKQYFPNHQRYLHILSHEIRSFGGHTVANLMRRGQGPSYHTIVCDVAKRLKLRCEEDEPIVAIERRILAHVLKDIYGHLDEEQKQLFVQEVQQYQCNNSAMVVRAVEKEDFGELSPKTLTLLSVVIASSVARIMGLTSLVPLVGGAFANSVSRLIGLLGGPLGWLTTALFSIYEFGGPAYRVTVPCVIHIAMLRIKQANSLLEYKSQNQLPHHGKQEQATENETETESSAAATPATIATAANVAPDAEANAAEQDSTTPAEATTTAQNVDTGASAGGDNAQSEAEAVPAAQDPSPQTPAAVKAPRSAAGPCDFFGADGELRER